MNIRNTNSSDSESDRENEQPNEGPEPSVLDRRSYLQITGAAVASIATAGSVAGSSPAEDPTVNIDDGAEVAGILEGIGDGETVVLPQGTYTLSRDVSISANDFTLHGNGATIETHGRRQVNINGTGWDFGHLEIVPQNQSDPDAWCQFQPEGDQWHFHHVAWTRRNNTRYTSGSDRRLSCILPGVDAGGKGEITDCWFGHGAHLDHGKSAIKCWGILDGELWIRRSYFYQMGVYGANSSQDYVRNEGVTNFESCYFENCYNACIRTGSHYDSASVRDCVLNTSDASDTPTRSGRSGGPYNRGVWAFHGPVNVENTEITSFDRAIGVSVNHNIRRTPSVDFRSGAYDGRINNSSRVTIDSSVGSNPSQTPPEDCVTSPEEAYLGTETGTGDSSSAEPENSHEHTLTVQGTGTTTNYAFSVSEALSGIQSSIEQWDSISDTAAEGWVTESTHRDVFGFDGEVTEFNVASGDARVFIDGEEVDPENVVSGPLEHTLLVDGVGTSGTTRYEFTVSGAAEKATLEGASVDDEDVIDSGQVTGTVGGWRDAFRFSGDLEELTVEGNARVIVDGEAVDPADYGQEQPHVLTIVGDGSSASYEITVDGTIERSLDNDSTDATVVSENAIEGSIERGVQRFRFSGVLSDVTFDGSAHVYVDDTRIDPDDYNGQERLPNAIVIDGTDTDGETSYSFDIDGEVAISSYREASIDADDEVDGQSVTGAVTDELDAYLFDGDIVDFRLTGDANVDVEYDIRND